MENSLPARPSLEQLKKQAKDLLKDHAVLQARSAETHPRTFSGRSPERPIRKLLPLIPSRFTTRNRSSPASYGFRQLEGNERTTGRGQDAGRSPPQSEPPAEVAQGTCCCARKRAKEKRLRACSARWSARSSRRSCPRNVSTPASESDRGLLQRHDYHRSTYMGHAEVQLAAVRFYFWRLWVEGWDSDILIRMALNSEGLISGLLYSPAWDSAIKK